MHDIDVSTELCLCEKPTGAWPISVVRITEHTPCLRFLRARATRQIDSSKSPVKKAPVISSFYVYTIAVLQVFIELRNSDFGRLSKMEKKNLI